MRYSPYEHESQNIADFNEGQILEYFLTRVFETEEVWGLSNGAEWIYRNEDQANATLPLWPYESYAKSAAAGEWINYHAQEASLEAFLYSILETLVEDDIMIELMPKHDQPGCLISPQQLFSILEGMLHAGEYRLDG
ncbi:MAG: DUF2750 domain-containing protein [Pseudomonadales bacterium]|nr:DUF2750 domain-containing protein [Pseudomonadales bacterium]